MRTKGAILALLLLLPAVAAANLMNFDSLPLGMRYEQPVYNPGDFAFSEDGIDAYVHRFFVGAAPFFNYAEVDPAFAGPSIFFGNLQILEVNNIAMIFDFPGSGDVSFKYLHLGGELNLRVNGAGPILQGPNMSSFIGSMPPGITMTVTPTPVPGGEKGIVRLTGGVSALRVGGQEFWLEDVEWQGEPQPCDYEVTHEALAVGDAWGGDVGDSPGVLMFVEDGIPVHAENFYVSGFTFFHICRVDVPGLPGFGFNNVMSVNNISNRYDIAALGVPVEKVTFEYADLGGAENLSVNGYPVQIGDFPTFVDPAPGVTLGVVTYAIPGGGERAEVTLTGNVQELIVGGQEFYLDNLCVVEGAPPEPCDYEVTHESLSVGDAWGNPYGTPPGSLMFVEDGIPVYIDQIDLGSGLFYDQCFVDTPGIPGFGFNKVMVVNNVVNRYEIAALGINVQQVSFEFADYGGTENLGVNGFPVQIGDIETFGNPAPGVTINVITSAIPAGGIRGLVTLTGDVQDLVVGGQEFFLDNLCVDEGEAPPPCDYEVNHETLTIGDLWGDPVGTPPGTLIFTEDGIPVVIGEFDFGGGTSYNYCEVIPAAMYPGFGAGNAMAMNNVVNKYDIGALGITVAQVTFEYVDLGGDENLQVNGGPLQIGDLDGFVNPAPGVTISVATFPIPGGVRGEVTLTGNVQVLVVGGQEFALDEICVVTAGPPPTCDHLADHESQPLGAAWGGPWGQSPGDFIFTEDDIRVFVANFDDGFGIQFNQCRIDNAYSPAGDGQVMTINNIGVVYSVSHLGEVTESVSFEFFDGDGIENLGVNGDLYVGELEALPAAYFPGVTATVTVYSGAGFQWGEVLLEGDVQRVLIGGQQFYADNVCFNRVVTAVGSHELPAASALELQPNTPNPFNPSTTLNFSLARAGHVRLDVYDARGRVVRTLVDGRKDAGTHQVVWDGRDGAGRSAAAGVYFVRVQAANEVRTQKIALIK